MPQKWKELVDKVRKSLSGKTNPRTKKPYSDSDIYAVAMAQYKKLYGSTPKSDEMVKLINEDNPGFMLLEFFAPIQLDIKEGKLAIKGVAIDSSISRNNVKYTPEELEKAAHTLINKPILNSHKTDDVFGILGRVVEAHYDSTTQTVPFTADIMDVRAQEYVKDGRIANVSIGAHAQELINEDENSDVVTAKGIEFLELSFVPIPGIKNATITQAITEKFDFIKEINKIYDEILREEEQEKLNGDNMENTIVESPKVVETAKIEVPAENPLLKENLELKAKLDEIAKEKKAKLVESVIDAELKAGWVKEDQKDAEKAVLEKLDDNALNLLLNKASVLKEVKEEVKEIKAQPKSEVTITEVAPQKSDLIKERFNDGVSLWRMPTDSKEKIGEKIWHTIDSYYWTM